MDEPFAKRPRLSMLANHSPGAALDDDLGSLRYRNDSLLKSRFESIFEKYSKDFSGIGDEVDLMSGEIIVDNGHLHSIRAETDTGVDEEDVKGKAFLRAMTEARDREDSYFNEGADDVLMSIEEIAENAAVTMNNESDTPEDSEDDLFQTPRPVASLATPPDSRGYDTIDKSDPFSLKSESDTDSLFDVPNAPRDSSPDSLFGARSVADDIDEPRSQFEDSSLVDSAPVHGNNEESDLLAKYGQRVGSEVINMLRRERANAEAHIEPAWRIPSNIIPPKNSISPAIVATPPPLHSTLTQSPGIRRPFTRPPSRPIDSLWKAPPATKGGKIRKNSQRRRVERKLRADSEDPLQDGFASDRPYFNNGDASGSEYEVKTKTRKKKAETSHVSLEEDEEEEEEDEQIKALQQGLCVYCGQQWKTRTGIISHWAKLVERFETRNEIDDMHDIVYILAYRQETGPTAQRSARLVLSDYRTMVELHEGAGLSFAEIADCGALRTRKTGPGLVDVYDRYRIAPEDEAEAQEWSPQELASLEQLCENPLRDMSTFSKQQQLNGRSDFDIAGKLAEIWLRELQKSIRPPNDGVLGPGSHISPRGVGLTAHGQARRRGSTEDPLFIKEECED